MITPRTSPVGAARDSHKPIPPKLYKYRPFNTFFLRILSHLEVSYSDPRSFNDPLDCNPTIEVDIDRHALEQLCYRFLLQAPHSSESAAAAELNRYRYLSTEYGDFRLTPAVEAYLKYMLADRIKAELGREFGTWGVFSLSERWDCPLMWSHYADYHKGICIEFDTSDVPHPALKPVDYQAPRSVRASDLVAWKLQNSTEAEKRVSDTYFNAKAAPWRYEKEWRDLSDTNGVRQSDFRVSAIYFGLRCDPAVIHAVVKLLASDHDVTLYDIYPLNDSFRLRRRLTDRSEFEARGLGTSAVIEFSKDVILPK